MENKFIRAAIAEAKKALKKEEVPVGAVIVINGRIISRAHNLIESKNNPTAHAEIIAIRKAGQKLKNWRLNGAVLYVTLEPCPLCKNAIIQSRISKVVFGCRTEGKIDAGRVKYEGPVMQQECSAIIKKFFKKARKFAREKRAKS